MAPDIINEQVYGKPVDIWALGVITHVLLTGSPPFFGVNKEEIFS